MRSHSHLVADLPLTALKGIANAECATDLFDVKRLALVRKGRAWGDHEASQKAGEEGREALGNGVGEIVLRRVSALAGEGENNEGEAGCLRGCADLRGNGLNGRWRRAVQPNADR